MATPQLSPGVLVREVDLTIGRAENVLDNIGAIAGPFEIGPVDDIIEISTEDQLVNTFGKPIGTDAQYQYWMAASSYLSYGGVLKVVRTAGGNLNNANAGVGIASTTTLQIYNYDDYLNNHQSDATFTYAAKNPGTWGNGLKVCQIDNAADQIIGVATGNLYLAGARVGFGITANIDGAIVPGIGTTGGFTGYLKGIITGVSTATGTGNTMSTIDVKITSRVSEIAGVTSAIGASYTGDLAITTTSGPGIALKGEALGLAVMTELPLVVINVQRGGPSTGLPTKTEQSDLNQALYGRNGEAPMPVIAAATPGDCFFAAYEACKAALTHMTPVMLLTDGYLANGSEPWNIPDVNDLEPIEVKFAHEPNADGDFLPYLRDEKTLARPWAIPGTPKLEHRVGGIETAENTGHVSYDPENHHKMVVLRQEKVNRIQNDMAPTEVYGEKSGDLLILSWGGTYGACRSATETLQEEGKSVSHVHIRWISPLPKDLGEILIHFKNILIPEINLGQLLRLIRSEYLVDAKGLNLVRGRPIGAATIVEKVKETLG